MPEQGGVIPSSIRIMTINEVEEAPNLEPLWGNWIFRNSVVVEVGEPGISKTTFNFALCKAIVDNKPFLGISPVNPGLRVLYMEYEAATSLVKSRMNAMGYPANCQNFLLYNNPEHILRDVMSYIDAGLVECNADSLNFDILFIDTIRLAFSMRDENDNAEGARQMRYFRQLSQRYNCAVIAVHHPTKQNFGGLNKASGAGARVALADVVMNFDRLLDEEGVEIDRDIFSISIPKNRLIDDDFLLFVHKKAEGRKFEACDPPLGYWNKPYEPVTQRYTCQTAIYEVLNPYVDKSVDTLHREIGQIYTRQMVHKALQNLIALGQAIRVDARKYRRATNNKEG